MRARQKWTTIIRKDDNFICSQKDQNSGFNRRDIHLTDL